MELNPQTLVLDTAKEALTLLREEPSRELLYASYGFIDAFIRLAEQTGRDLDPRVLAYRETFATMIDED